MTRAGTIRNPPPTPKKPVSTPVPAPMRMTSRVAAMGISTARGDECRIVQAAMSKSSPKPASRM